MHGLLQPKYLKFHDQKVSSINWLFADKSIQNGFHSFSSSDIRLLISLAKYTNKEDIEITNELFYYNKNNWVNNNPQYWLSQYNKYIGYIDIAISKYENILIDKKY